MTDLTFNGGNYGTCEWLIASTVSNSAALQVLFSATNSSPPAT
jgi:hypothetical protein